MIYEYPENFVVPVVYDKNLNQMNRDWEFKYMKVDELSIPPQEVDDIKLFHMNEPLQDKGENFLGMKENKMKKTCKESMYNDCSILYKEINDEEIKCILKDIDNEYANSETMRI
ncbi:MULTISPECIES: hypothetical protein [unclassified Clostridium]|uniref:hypothetical protein n=1 Tax=unclassified Clostridium TaxID=2614128 RepID=UPI0002984206|nr:MULTISPECIES: hypothetical protein [unclassified Clostridium]EKQ58171.1 MAG: hypothetical protein A370_00207 [Clostridium sp. Maddingley MBC34-26]